MKNSARWRGSLATVCALDDVKVQMFALVREVASRTIGLRPFDVQILGGLALHASQIIQMQTGEGKPLAAAPAALNALLAKGGRYCLLKTIHISAKQVES